MLARLKAFLNPPTRNPLRAPQRIFWVAFLVRVLVITIAHTYRFRVGEDHFQYGWEAGRIARALVTGYGYSDPFANAYIAHTGPTAWLPPIYPLLIAGIFKLFGVYTLTSAWVLLTFQSVFSAATALATWEIAARCFNRRVALWSAWIWALYPAAMQYAVRWPWEMTITTALFTFTLVLTLRMRHIGESTPEPFAALHHARRKRSWFEILYHIFVAIVFVLDIQTVRHPAPPILNVALSALFISLVVLNARYRMRIANNGTLPMQWLVFGGLWGLIALSNSTLLIFLPVCGLWILAGSYRRPYGFFSGFAAALIFLALITPWTIRNQRAFHTFIPLRGNFGAELYMGNGPGSNGLLMEFDHPFQAPDQLHLYASMGEVRYVALRAALAKAYIAAHPAHFLADCARRVYFFWAGVPHPSDEAWYNEIGRTLNFAFISVAGLLGLALALSRRVPAAGLFAWAFLLLPVPYYIVTVHARFRHPLEPLIAILGVYLFQSATRKVPAERQPPQA